MKDKYQEQWENLGTTDPYWAVLADPDKEGGRWNSVEFFDTGETEICNVLEKIKFLGVQIKFDTALDFGCGVGRLSRSLASRFRRVIAVDVSRSMLQEARKANQHMQNIDFIHNPVENLSIIPEGSIDFLYSNIALQHMPKNRQVVYIKEFCRVLCPGGMMAIQTPAKCNLKTWRGWAYFTLGNDLLNIWRRIKYGASKVMEVHAIPRKQVLETLGQAGLDVLKVERYDSAGSAFESYMYFARKS